MKTIKLRIDDCDDREALVSILARNGYWCKVEKDWESLTEEVYYVVIQLKVKK